MPRLLPRRDARRFTPVLIAFTAAASLVLSACGSQLDPETVALGRAGATAGVTADGTTGGPAPELTLSAPGAGAGDPGDAGGAPPGAAGTPGSAPAPNTGDDAAPPGAGATSGGAAATDDAAAPGADGSATGDGPAGDCDGFENGPGITDRTVTLANVADISGPVPGLFESARQATQAFVSFYNSTEDLCGRSLELLTLDSRGDAGADQQAYATACEQAFAAVGSVSAFDAGGAATAERCGLPDIRSATVTPERQTCSTCFAAYTVSTSTISDTIPKFWLKAEPDASQHVGIFYVNVSAAKVNAEAFARAYEKAGMTVDVLQPIDTGEFNFATYVQQMKDNDIDFVQYFGPYQFAVKLQQAMQQQSFSPAVYFQDPTIYDDNYLEQAGDLADDVYVFTTNELFDDTRIREMALYRSWLEQVSPGAVPNYYGLYAWSAARLFVEQATALGGDLTQDALVARMRQVKAWTSNGLHAPMAVGGKTTSPCAKIIQYDGSSWRSVSGSRFTCGGLVDAG